MRLIYIILFLFVSLGINAQYLIRDAKGRVIATGGALLSYIAADTFGIGIPVDTASSFSISAVSSDSGNLDLQDSIFAQYSLEETSGNASDQVGINDLTAYGSIIYDTTGKIDSCYYLATDAYLEHTGDEFEFSGSFSLLCWMQTTEANNNGALITNYALVSSDGYGYDLLKDQGGANAAEVDFCVRAAGSDLCLEGTTVVNDGNWHLIAASWNDDDDTAKIWVDGNLDAKDKFSTGEVGYHANCKFWVGDRNDPYDLFYEGRIDEITIYRGLELSKDKIDSIYNAGAGRHYPFGITAAADSMQIEASGLDPLLDTLVFNYRYDHYPTNIDDGILDGITIAWSAGDITGNAVDTTIYYNGLKDTIIYGALHTCLDGLCTDPPNRDTTIVDSAGFPASEPQLYDTIFYQDFEHRSTPLYYTYSYESPDFNNEDWFASDHRWPSGWSSNTAIQDSIITDPISGSKVFRSSFDDATIDGYDGQGTGRGGEYFRMDLGAYEPKEVYLSYNMMLRPGFDPVAGGKFLGMKGGSWYNGPPISSDEGFKANLAWEWPTCPCPPGCYNCLAFYISYQDMPGPYSQMFGWGDFQPSGTNLNYYSNGRFYFDVTDSTWYNITIRYVMNTYTGSTPNKDGIIEGFINGKLIEQVSGLYLLSYDDVSQGVNELWFSNYWGGGGPPARDEWVLFDDIAVWTYDESADVVRGNNLSQEGRVITPPGWPKE